MKIILIKLDPQYSMATYPSVLTLISDFFLLSEVATMWQIDSVAHKLKPRLFYKSAHLCQVWFIPEVKVHKIDSEMCELVE